MQSSLNAITKLDMSSFKTQEERVKAVMNAITGLSDKQVELILNNTNLHDSIKDAVIQTQAQKIATDATTASQVKQISTTEALSVKMTTLGATIKAALPWLIPVALLAGAVTAYAAYQKKIKETAESAEECAASLKEFHDTTSKNLKTVESLSDRYEELNKGVSNLGKNISLTTDEYNEYQSICNQLADIMPDLVDYYDQTGTAILKTTGRAEDLTRAYKEQAKAAANAFLMSNDKENSPKSINDNYDNYFEQKFTLGNSLESIENRRGRYQSSINIKDALSKDYDEFISMLNQFKGTDLYSYFKKILEKGGYDITEINKDNFSNIRNVLSSYLDTLETELGERVTGIQSILKNQLIGSDEYWNMDEDAANAVSKLISNIDSEFINANNLNTLSGQNEFVDSLVKNIYKNQDDFAEALASLFSSDTTINEVTSALNILGSIIGVNIDELIRMLGLENEQDAKRILSDSIRSISEKHQGVPGATLMTGYNDEDITWLEDKTKDFTDEQAIMWASVTDGIYGAAEAWEAWEKHLANIPEVDKNKFAISSEDAEALSEYQSKIDSISDSLANKYNLTAGDITSLMTDFSEYADIWEMYGVNEYGEGDIEGALEAIAQKLKEETANKIPQMRSYIEGMYETVLNPKGNADKLQLEVDDLKEKFFSADKKSVYNASETAALINQYPELADAVKVLADGYYFEEDALIDLTNTKMTAANEAIAYEIEQTEQAIKKTKERIEARKLELEATEKIRLLQGRSALLDQREEQAVLFDENGVMQSSTDLKINKYEDELNELYEQLNKLITDYEGNINELIKNAGTELFDWYETRISRIEDRITDFGNTVSDVYSAWGVREEALLSQITETGNLYEAQMAAREAYLEKANAVGLDKSYVDKIKQDQYDFDEETDADLIADIQEYIEWYEKAIDMENAAAESQRTLNELRTQGFEQIQTQYDTVLADFENQASLIEAGLANAEARGQLAVQGFYQQLYTNEEMNRAALVAERIALEEALNKLGVTGGEEFDRLQDEIDGVTIAIAESENALLEFENAIRDADWGIFDFNREQAQRVMGESDFLLDLLDAKKLVDEMGEFTDNGLASIGLHGVNYNGYLEESIRYTKELAKLEEELAKEENANNTDLIKRRNELLEQSQEMILAAENEKMAIADLVREAYENMKSSLRDLIDEYGEMLDVNKDLYDQEKRRAQSAKTIANLQKQIAAYFSGPQTEETRAKLQQLRVELADSRSSLEDDIYSQYVSDQKDILNSVYENYETFLDDKAEDTERLFQEAIDQAKTNTSAMKNTVETAAGAVGYDIDTGVDDLLSDSSSLNLNLNQVEARLLSNGTSITDGVEQIDGTNQIISGNITSLVNNTTGLNEWIGQVKDAISGENGISGKLDDIKSKVAEIAGKDFTVNVDNGNNTPDIKPDGKPQGSGNTEPKVGDKIQSLSGSWYESSDGTGNIGTVDKKDPDYWILDKINKGSKYPYHVIGLKNNGAFAGSGWVKNFPEYATGLQKANKDHLAWTQDGGDEIIIRPSDGAVLTPITRGSTVLDATATQNLRNMANDPAKFIRDNLTFSIPDIDMAGRGNIENNIAISIPLENVTDVQSFLVEFQRNPKIQAVIKDMIAESTLGTSSLAKYRHKMK